MTPRKDSVTLSVDDAEEILQALSRAVPPMGDVDRRLQHELVRSMGYLSGALAAKDEEVTSNMAAPTARDPNEGRPQNQTQGNQV